MDQRRFIAFLLLSLAAMWFVNSLFPPQKPAPKPGAVADAKADGKDGAKALPPAANAPPAVDNPKAAAAPAAPAAAPIAAVAAADTSLQFVTLGSLDMASDYRMLVTLSNAGASVHRAEMASPRYRDLHDWSGYLGDLQLKSTADGLRVQVVGPGTPAANAKTQDGKPAPLEAEDIIVGVVEPQSTAVKTPAEFSRVLATTAPGGTIILQVKHGDEPPQVRVIKLVRTPFAVLRPESENYAMRGVQPPEGFTNRPSFLSTLTTIDNTAPAPDDAKHLSNLLESGTWEVVAHDQASATFRRTLPELKLELVKRYTIAKAPAEERDNPNFPAYNLNLQIEIRNTGDAARSLAYRLDGPTGMPLEGWWYAHKISQRWFSTAGLRDIVVRFAGSQELQIDCPKVAEGDIAPMGDGKALTYAGVDGQYFSAVLIPQIKTLEDVWFDSTEAILVGPKPDERTPSTYANVTCRLSRTPIVIQPGGSQSDSYTVFIGPKRPDLLAQYYAANDPNYSLRNLLYYGWPIFGAVARAMLAILHFFHGIVGNYGIAIIMLTVLVRGCMFPISFKQTQNIAQDPALKPEMDRINEKYKSDMQKKSQATQELYRKHKINPLAGCLPVFLQLPIFMGLYRALAVDVELRQSPLFGSAIRWCSNLAAPDMLWNWSAVMPDFINSGQGLFGLGPYLNVLPLITVVLFLVTQKMAMPAPTNEQAVMQQKMMKYMTMFMGIMFYKVASGLCLYFIASSLWGIAERKLLPKTTTTEAATSAPPNPPPSRSTSNGSPGSKRARSKRK